MTKEYIKYKDKSISIQDRCDDLLQRMTLDEKLAQLVGVWKNAELFIDDKKNINIDELQKLHPHGLGQMGRLFEGLSAKEIAQKNNELQSYFVENTRLGIPILFHEECLHGVMEYDAISFPHPIALAGSFNLELIEEMYSFIAKDARARGARLALTPVLDVARDPRWGRVEETFGEDPYLIAQMGTSAIKGFQGEDADCLHEEKIMATLKHFAAHGEPENGTNCGPANYSERVLREVFLYPFQYAIKNAKPKAVMAAYNEIDGVPCHANEWLLKDILRNEFGFDGFVVSDYYGVEQLHERHKIVSELKDAALRAFTSGIDIELPEPYIYKNLKLLLENNELDISYINEAVGRLLYFKFYCGLFDNPYVDEQKAEAISTSADAVELSYEIASECAVLLKNELDILPLKYDSSTNIAVIGPNAKYHSIGGYSCPNKNFLTIYDGILNKYGKKANILYAKGCGITTDDGSWFVDEVNRTSEDEDRQLIDEAIEIANKSDVIILCIGGNEQTSREAWKEDHLGDRANLEMVGLQNELFEKLHETGKPIIVVLNHGRPLAISNINEKAQAIIDCWYLGQETGRVVADIIDGTINPSGKLAISIPRSAGHLPSFYNHKPTARRGYLFDDISPLFPFGYGLSYSNFNIENISIEITNSEKVMCKIRLEIYNLGDFDGSETIQVYVRDCVSSVTRPIKELKAFRKVLLRNKEVQHIEISLPREAFAFYNKKMQYVIEPGDFEIMIGTSSLDEDLQKFKITI